MIEAASHGNEPLPSAFIEDAPALPVTVQEGCSCCVDSDSGCVNTAGTLAQTGRHAVMAVVPADTPYTGGLPSVIAGFCDSTTLAMGPGRGGGDHATVWSLLQSMNKPIIVPEDNMFF